MVAADSNRLDALGRFTVGILCQGQVERYANRSVDRYLSVGSGELDYAGKAKSKRRAGERSISIPGSARRAAIVLV